MALHPDVQEEIFEIIKAEVKGDVTYENLKKIRIVDAALKESQRLFTNNPILARECDETTTVKGITIDKV